MRWKEGFYFLVLVAVLLLSLWELTALIARIIESPDPLLKTWMTYWTVALVAGGVTLFAARKLMDRREAIRVGRVAKGEPDTYLHSRMDEFYSSGHIEGARLFWDQSKREKGICAYCGAKINLSDLDCPLCYAPTGRELKT